MFIVWGYGYSTEYGLWNNLVVKQVATMAEAEGWIDYHKDLLRNIQVRTLH